MKTEITEVKYGRTNVHGLGCGYAVWQEGEERHEVIVPDYKDMVKLVDGKKTAVRKIDTVIWAKVAGDMGTEELARCLKEN